MNAPLAADPEAALAFLDLLHPGGPWVLTAITPDGPATTETFSTLDAAAAWITRENARRNIYWMPAEATGPLRRKATKDQVARTFLLWADLDGITDPGRLNGHAPPPTTIVASGGGLNLYWTTTEPIRDRDEIEARCRWLAKQLGADACWNCDRILRLPGTVNWPNSKKKRQGRVPVLARCTEHHPDRLYDFDDFGRIEPDERQDAHTADLGDSDIQLLTIDDLPAEVREKLPARAQRLIREGPMPGEYDGDRSRAVMAVAFALVRAGASDAQIAGILLNPDLAIHAHIADQKGHGPRAYVARQIERAREKIEEEPHKDDPPEPSSWRERLDLRRASDLEGKEIKPREWVVPLWVPQRHLTGLYGPGSAGKTTLATQLCCAASVEGGHWLGMPVRKSKAFGFFCEDDDDEIERKIYDTAMLYGHRRADYRDFAYLGRFGCDNLLFVRTRAGMGTTPLYADLCQMVGDERLDLLVFDGIPDIYALNINDQGEVTWALSMMLAMGKPTRASIILLGHPNKIGSSEFTGCGAWENKPRARLYLGPRRRAATARSPS